MTVKELYPNIFVVKCPNQYELTSTFMRVQEFYESPFKEIKGVYFTYEKFFDKYVKDNKLTYWGDWAGFNVPGAIYHDFICAFVSDKLTNREIELYQTLKDKRVTNVKNYDKPFYLIGIYRNDSMTHELSHAFYYLYDDYRISANQCVASLSKAEFNKRCQYLASSLYSPQVFMDEIQAYGVSKREKPFYTLYQKYVRMLDKLVV